MKCRIIAVFLLGSWFIIIPSCKKSIRKMTVSTGTASSITHNSASVTGTIIDLGEGANKYGHCYSITENPTVEGTKKELANPALGDYTSNLGGLIPNTRYYVKAYLGRGNEIVYGSEINFKTEILLTAPSAPTIGTATAGNALAIITFTPPAIDGGSPITVYTATSNPDNRTGTGSASPIIITGLTNGVPYTFTVTAANVNGTSSASSVSNTVTPLASLINDVDWNVYNTFTIGVQRWMKENLRTTKYNDGTSIPLVTDNASWGSLNAPGYCWYNNDAATFKATYGALYNWYTVNTGMICPSGWHVPTDTEWTTLESYLIDNGYNYDGATTGNKIAKALASITLWTSSTTTGAVGNTDYNAKRNASGFTAFPGGDRQVNGAFFNIGNYGYWWSSTATGTIYAWLRYFGYNSTGVTRSAIDFHRKYGLSIRCIKD